MRYIVILILISALLSCKGVPQRTAAVDLPASAEEAQTPAVSGDGSPELSLEPLFPDEPIVEAPPGEPVVADVLENLLEPVADLAEADQAEFPPEEGAFTAVLPEPPAPVVEAPTSSVPALSPVAPVLPPSVPAIVPSAPTPPPPRPAAPPVAPVPPSSPPVETPPRFIRPAEEETLPPIVREPVPLPVRPIPGSPFVPPPSILEDEVVFSRVIRATVGQLVEVPFRGTGWVYLGELAARRGISYDSRRLDPDGQSFVFRAEAAGTYALKFYKQDFIRDFILNDHVQVIIGEAPEVSATGFFNPAADRSRVIAEPRWPSPAEEAEAFRRSGNPAASAPAAGVSPSGPVPGNAQRPGIVDEGIVPVRPPEVSAGGMDGGAVPAMPVQPAVPDTLPAPPSIPFAQYLQQAQEEFDAGRVAAAIGVLDKFREGYPSGSDEAYWLYGQFYEANSPSRDIRLSLDYYRRLVREYPQSKRYNEARRRIAYLERYYINIQ